MTSARNFLGIPVQGDITPGATRVEQKPIEELQPIIQAVLDDPTIVEFGWRQYTPYFNDGDPCEFSAYGLWVRTDADKDVDDQYELEVYSHPSLGKVSGSWVANPENPGGSKVWQDSPYEGPDEARYRRCKALSAAVEGGAFEHVLLEAFGDHAQVTVRRDGIEVEFYQHD
ncbi:hypothetical protein AAW14_06085 [Streptomyces hygroscopicus]|uniref:hypothetical protein n=1 Tax=Streptomyces hygroscopicus TaxID=1912 RepID=UPI00223F3D6F|nr:hypothetical protein [Streptomyces hygroscopicus]MCW7941615.1 hypothetical protein [Streptomyces hygroscopicus]